MKCAWCVQRVLFIYSHCHSISIIIIMAKYDKITFVLQRLNIKNIIIIGTTTSARTFSIKCIQERKKLNKNFLKYSHFTNYKQINNNIIITFIITHKRTTNYNILSVSTHQHVFWVGLWVDTKNVRDKNAEFILMQWLLMPHHSDNRQSLTFLKQIIKLIVNILFCFWLLMICFFVPHLHSFNI